MTSQQSRLTHFLQVLILALLKLQKFPFQTHSSIEFVVDPDTYVYTCEAYARNGVIVYSFGANDLYAVTGMVIDYPPGNRLVI